MQEVQKEALVKILGELKTKGYEYLKQITAVDYVDHLQVVYILYNLSANSDEIVTVKLPPNNPQLPSVMHLYKAADWYELEIAEMFGIAITGRRTKRLLLEKWNGTEYPLRKSFVWGNPNYKRPNQ